MNNHQLTSLAQKCVELNSGIFQGVYAANELPQCLRRDSFIATDRAYIVNTDKKGGTGMHWVAIYIPAKESELVEYFDSYGLVPYITYINSFIGLPDNYVFYNDITLQAPLSSVCGQYSLFYVCLRACGFHAYDILQLFRWNDPYYNDNFVNSAVEWLFDTSLKVYDIGFIKKQISTAFVPSKFIVNDHD